MKARKKPVVVECVKWTGDNLQEVRDFVGNYLIENYIEIHTYNKRIETLDSIEIRTLEGNHLCNIGDYIIKGVQGEFYPCKPDIFAETYEVVEDDKTVAKKIVYIKNKITNLPVSQCPNCGIVEVFLEKFNYCHNCGQRLERSDEDA